MTRNDIVKVSRGQIMYSFVDRIYRFVILFQMQWEVLETCSACDMVKFVVFRRSLSCCKENALKGGKSGNRDQLGDTWRR